MKNYRLRSDILVFDRLLIQLPGSIFRWALTGFRKKLVVVAKERPFTDIILGTVFYTFLLILMAYWPTFHIAHFLNVTLYFSGKASDMCALSRSSYFYKAIILYICCCLSWAISIPSSMFFHLAKCLIKSIYSLWY